MALQFHPKIGTVVICDYDTGFRPPEMVKQRLAVVMSPRLPHRNNLCTVVPLSTSAPEHRFHYQCKVELPIEPPKPFEGRFKWAKADMLATVGLNRLTLPHTRRDKSTGKRQYVVIELSEVEITQIRLSMLYALGMEYLTLEQ